MYRFLSFLFLLMAGIYSQSGWSETCRANVGQMPINVSNIKFLPTLPVNTQMTGAIADNGNGITFTCDFSAPKDSVRRIVYKQLKLAAPNNNSPVVVINGQHVFPSAIPGIGYSLGFQCNGGPMRAIDGSRSAGNESVVVCDSSELPTMGTQQQMPVKIYVTFYKTGTVQFVDGNHTSSPELSEVGEMTMEQQGGGRSIASSPVMLSIAALNVESGSNGSCQVATSSISVNLGSVNRVEFKGEGMTAGQAKTFTIPVFCPTPTDIRIGFFGVTRGADTLALSKETDSAEAKGVGVRLTYGNNPGAGVSDGTGVKINETSNLPVLKRVTGANASAADNINFTAQYVQSDAAVSAGTANSMVTFLLVYN